MALAAESVRAPAAGWLRNRHFDLLLICGLTAISLAAGGLIALVPASVVLVMLADSWVLGYPHVAATFVRIAPDKIGLNTHRFLLFVLPLLVLSATALLAVGIGIVAIATIYFYWQWYHTLRQSWGVAQLYRRRSQVPVREHPLFAEGLFTLVALWGLLHRMAAAPDHFLFPYLTISVPAIPFWLADGVGYIAIAGLAWWTITRIRDALAGELPVAHTLFSASHYLIFIFGYVVLDNVVGGWLVTNIWHTTQYLMIVWLFNQNASAKLQAQSGWFIRASRGNRALLYFGVCFLLAFPAYYVLSNVIQAGEIGLLSAIVLNQSINFHHFITDAVIWRARRKPAGAPA